MATGTGAKAKSTKSGRRGGKIFISYRRQDSDESAGRVRDWLTQPQRIPADDVFMDVHDVAPGDDFVAAVGRAISKCRTMLVIIGPDWLTGHRKLSPHVEEEVAQALNSDVHVIPVLVRGAAMPAPETVPPRIQQLAYLNASKVRPDEDFDHDMRRLASAIGMRSARPGSRRSGRVWVSVLGVLLLAGGLAVLTQAPENNPVWQMVHGRVLASETFLGKQAGGWDDDGVTCVPMDDGYHVIHNAACGSPVYGVEDRTAYTVAVTTREVGPNATAFYGLRVRSSSGGGYEFLISSAGEFSVELDVANQQRTHLLGGVVVSPHVITGVGASNRLEVEVDGSRLGFIINGHPVAHIDDDTFKRGSIAFVSLHRQRILTHAVPDDAQRQSGNIAYTDLKITAPMFGG